MEEMHIIEQTPVTSDTSMFWIVFILGVVVAMGALIVLNIKNGRREKDKIVLIFYAIGIAIMILSTAFTVETGRYTYKCTFDDNITVKDITEHFDIIDVVDDVWIVKDKER